MATVNTVLGPMDTKDLGFTLMHEHVLLGFGGVHQAYPELLGENISGLSESEAAKKSVKAIRKLCQEDLGMPKKLSDVGLTKADIPAMAQEIDTKLAGPIGDFINSTNPRSIAPGDVARILTMAL